MTDKNLLVRVREARNRLQNGMEGEEAKRLFADLYLEANMAGAGESLVLYLKSVLVWLHRPLPPIDPSKLPSPEGPDAPGFIALEDLFKE